MLKRNLCSLSLDRYAKGIQRASGEGRHKTLATTLLIFAPVLPAYSGGVIAGSWKLATSALNATTSS